jgi:hypothetical protein
MGSEDTQNHARTEKEKRRETGEGNKKMENGEGEKGRESGESRRESGEGRCGTCAQPATLKCTACKLVSYCDKNCQAAPT